ncbi:MAG: alpha-amylase family glycosyl hydrolase [Myxococcota bacterium]
MSDPSDIPWWQRAVFYQIYPRSFAGSPGGGVGDLAGIHERLDHLEWLGVDAIWLSPFYRSPMKDFGYDVSDYCDVDPLFGDLAGFERLLRAAHARGMRMIVDFVPAHSSSEHPWFLASRSSRENAKREWYVWRDPAPDGGPPNNWKATFDPKLPAWTLDETTGQYYLHSFLPEQPDLNWEHPPVVEAMHDAMRFWLDLGVDGFRIDVVHNIGKDPALPDVPEERAALPHSVLNDDPRTHEHLRGIRRLLDGYVGERMAVGEVFLLQTERVASYFGEGDELHLCFNFPPLFAAWDAKVWRDQVDTAEREFGAVGGWPTWVLSNHDFARHRTRYGSEARARAAAVLLLTLRGTPFLYMGEELGLEDAEIPPERVVDPGGRDGCRAPIPWERGEGHGWDTETWLPFPPDAAALSVEAQREDDDSMLHLYRRLLSARHASPALQSGDVEWMDAPDGVLAWRRQVRGDARIVVVNFTGEELRVRSGAGSTIEVASDGANEGEVFDGLLCPDRALILR